ncbi:MAG: tRNA pseudouridine(38-40) synthase TruA [Cyclobacteriaceae bacterium]|nr:tRNA pseudouridine(38-40) synthase TruA [Cyclobacteriaceae bacterium]
MRYFFQISYKGTHYHGWQIQHNALSVQQVLQQKMSQLISTDIEITGSGRTDTGVHARQQYFHADLPHKIDPEDFRYHYNAILPRDMVVHTIQAVAPNAHARFDALSRAYEYRIIANKDPFEQGLAFVYAWPLHLDLLNQASSLLLGKQDFESFSKVRTQVNHFVCEISEASWQQSDDLVVFRIKADRFLRGMVRTIVGTLLMVNEGKICLDDIQKILASRERAKAGRSVPPEGLYLTEICYPSQIFLN